MSFIGNTWSQKKIKMLSHKPTTRKSRGLMVKNKILLCTSTTRKSCGLLVKLKKAVAHIHHEKISWSPGKNKNKFPTHPPREDLVVKIKNIVTHNHHEKILWSRG